MKSKTIITTGMLIAAATLAHSATTSLSEPFHARARA